MNGHDLIKKGPYIFTAIGLLIGTWLINQFILKMGVVGGIMIAVIPLGVVLAFFFGMRPYAMLWLYIGVNYYIMGVSRYVSVKPGMFMMGFSLLLLIVMLVCQWLQHVEWRKGFNALSLLWGIWFVYCGILAFLPGSNLEAWMISFNACALIPLLLVLLVPVIFQHYRDLKIYLFVFSLFTLTAIAKALWQKFVGFDTGEKIFLYQEGGARTHLIWSGTRYFSFFTDASNFGAAMAFALVIYVVAALHIRSKIRYYYLLVAVLAAYGLGLSGTRSAMIIPFVGFLVYIITSRKWHILLVGSTVLLLAFCFFKYTHIGSGNAMIYRMRSTFNPNKDASFQVRMENQDKLRLIMLDKPFGVGLGLGGGKAKRFDSNAVTSWIATDSWYVILWVETGIFGLALYLLLHAFILGIGAWRIMFRIRSPELKGILGGLLAGVAGIMVGCYAAEITNFPNGPIIYITEALIFAGHWYDQELATTPPTKQLTHGA